MASVLSGLYIKLSAGLSAGPSLYAGELGPLSCLSCKAAGAREPGSRSKEKNRWSLENEPAVVCSTKGCKYNLRKQNHPRRTS